MGVRCPREALFAKEEASRQEPSDSLVKVVGGLAHEAGVHGSEVTVDFGHFADPTEEECCLKGELVVAQKVEEGVVRLIVLPEAGLDDGGVAADW